MISYRQDSGSAAFEFALVMIPLMLLVFGIVEFGRLIWTKNALQQTAIATARCMGVRQPLCATGGVIDTAKAVTFARNRASQYSIAVPASAVVATASAVCSGQSGFATVAINTTFTTVVPLLRQFIGTTTAVTENACFPVQT